LLAKNLIKIEIFQSQVFDTVFCPPLICMSDPEKTKNIIFSLWGCENI